MRKLRLLLVEDDEDDYVITRDLLDDIAGGDYRLDWASNLETARDLLSLNEHDLCLMDYELGPVDGVSLLKEAQELGFTRPIIMLTGQDDERLDQLALSAGAVDYLVKSNLTESRLARSIAELNCLNDIGRKAEESPTIRLPPVSALGRIHEGNIGRHAWIRPLQF